MTPHNHREIVDGCYRCELGRDEVGERRDMNEDHALFDLICTMLHDPEDAFAVAQAVSGAGWVQRDARVTALEDAIKDIGAHAAPLAEDDDGFIATGYVVSVGAMHRAFGLVPGSARVPDTTETP